MTKKNAESADSPAHNSARAVRAAADALEQDDAAPTQFLLANGCVLGVKPVPPFLIRRAVTRLQRPTPPVVHIDEKGRDEEVPDDPAFVQALNDHKMLTFETGANVLLAAGTWLLSKPASVQGPDEDGWLEIAHLFQIDVDISGPIARYLSWLNLYALTSEQEYLQLLLTVSRGVGLTEDEVQQAMASFRGLAGRRADNGLPGKDARHGNRVRKAAPSASP